MTFLLMVINFTLIITKLKVIFDFWLITAIFFAIVLFYGLKIMTVKFIGALFKLQDLAKLAVFFSLLFDKTFDKLQVVILFIL